MTHLEAMDILHDSYKEKWRESDAKCEDFARIISRLLNENFLLKRRVSDKKDYFFIMENKAIFESFFAVIDYQLVTDDANAMYYIRTTADRNRLQLKKFDTALLLELRLFYYKKKREVTSEDGTFVSVDELAEAINNAQLYKVRKKISDYTRSLTILRQHKLVDFKGTKINGETTIEIYPSIMAILPQHELEDIEARIKALGKGEESEDEDLDESEAD